MRYLLGALGVALGAFALSAALPPGGAETAGAASPSPSPTAVKASPRPMKFTDEDLARYKAARTAPSPSPGANQPNAAASPGGPPKRTLPPPRGTAATGTKLPPLHPPTRTAPPSSPPPGSAVGRQEGTRPSPEPSPSADPQLAAEKEWRRRAKEAQAAVRTARAELAQAEADANGLFTRQLQSTDTNEIMRLRQEVTDANERVAAAKEAVKAAESSLAQLEEEARTDAVPPGWLRGDDR